MTKRKQPAKRGKRIMRDEATADETLGSGVVTPEETEGPAEDAQLADDAVGRLLLYVFRHGNVYAGAVEDAQAIARVIGVPFTAEGLEALAVAGLRA